MKIIINKPFGKQVTLISKNLTKITAFLTEHKIKDWIVEKTISVFKTGSSQVTIRHAYRGHGDYISHLPK